MKTGSKAWLIAAAFLIIIGAVIFVVSMSIKKWDFKEAENVQYKTVTIDVDDSFKNISTEADTEDISFKVSPDGKCRVEFYIEDYKEPEAKVSSDTLEIKVIEDAPWHKVWFSFNFESSKITVYLPEKEYGKLSVNSSTGKTKIPSDFSFDSIDISASTGDVECLASSKGDLNISLSTGDIEISDISAANVSLKVSTGAVKAKDVECKGSFYLKVSTGRSTLTNVTAESLTSKGSTGDLELTNVRLTSLIDVERSTGDIDLDGCDAGEILIVTDTGHIKGTLLTEKVFVTRSDTGRIDVPSTTSGGKCELRTDTGDIKIKLK